MKIQRQLPEKKKRWKARKHRVNFTAVFWGMMLLFGIVYLNLIHFNFITGGPEQPPYSSNVDINVAALPQWHGTPTNFTVTVLSDNETLLEWTNTEDSVGTVIRIGFGSYPASVTDGYPVYSGNGTSYTDTGNDLNHTGEAYYAAFADYDGSYSVDFSTGIAQGEGMLEIASSIQAYALLIGEWLFVLILFALALWRFDPWLYMITAFGVGFLGYSWYADYPIIGLVAIALGGFCIYKAVRYFTG